MKNFLKFLCGLLFVMALDWVLNKPNNNSAYITPKWERLKKSEGQIFFMPLAARKGSTATYVRVKSKDGSVNLTCSLYAHAKRCYQFNDLGQPESYYDQLAFKKATVWWLPIKHKNFSGLVYQIEQHGKVIISFETFDLSYQQDELKNRR